MHRHTLIDLFSNTLIMIVNVQSMLAVTFIIAKSVFTFSLSRVQTNLKALRAKF